MLKTKGTKITKPNGKSIRLKGVNLGGWLMMEAYFMHSPNAPERKFRREFLQRNSATALNNFDREFRNTFIQKSDLQKIARLKFNCVRVPFHYRLVERKPYQYDLQGVNYLDRVIRWAREYKIYVILDLHAAPGSQNHDWHSDSFGKADFWKKKSYQDRVLALWEFLADRYKSEPAVAGYDLLNESVLDDNRKLNAFYKKTIKRIRSVDNNHILFIEGNKWSQDISCLDEFDDDNYALSIHSYEPLDFTFNFVPHLKYPLKSKKGSCNKQTIKALLSKYYRISRKRDVPIFVGEFGVNYRQGLYGEHIWVKDTLSCFKEFGFHWTYWPWKAIKNSVFPDGLHSYVENPPWVHREGPLRGWETIPYLWRKHKKAMVSSWKTKNFNENKTVLKVVSDAARENS